MNTLLLVVHIVTCVVLVFVVLIQAGKDGGLGGVGGGSNQTVFGSSGGANFFTKFTAVLAGVFMVTSIFLTAAKAGKKASIFGSAPVETSSAPTIPAAAAPANSNTNGASPSAAPTTTTTEKAPTNTASEPTKH